MKLLRNIYNSYIVRGITELNNEPNIEEWRAFIDGLNNPIDSIEESYNKYKCRQIHFGLWKRVLLEIAALPIMLYKVICVKEYDGTCRINESSTIVIEKKKDVLLDDIFPAELKEKYSKKIFVDDDRKLIGYGGYMIKSARQAFIKLVVRYWCHPYFVIWCARELEKHSYYIKKYNPDATAIYIEERNVASPLLKNLYESNRKKLISFMHGHYLLQIIQAYMGFSEYYIWDNQYIDNFSNFLKCNIGEYIVYTPQKLKKKWDITRHTPEFYCTYYFSDENESTIKTISNVFERFRVAGKKCKVRMHPRIKNKKIKDLIMGTFPEEMIENPSNVTLKSSLEQTQYAVGIETTVLPEAYVEGREIVIDDISNIARFNNLYARRAIAVKYPHRLLSDLIRENEESDIS